MKVYTKTGDKGQTSLIGGVRVPKHHIRIEAYGTVDELNSYIGLIRDQEIAFSYKEVLKEIQDRLFTIGSALACDPEKETKLKIPDIKESDIQLLEDEMDKMDEVLEPMKSFILPGGHPTISTIHIARCVCRRAERLVVALAEQDTVDGLVIQYLNRLSDHLFVLSRYLAHKDGAEEITWAPRKG